MGYATITVPFCASCCGKCECVEEDLDTVITMDPCAVACLQSNNPMLYGTFSGVDFSGGHTLTYAPPVNPGDPSTYGKSFSDGGEVTTYTDSGCSGEGVTTFRLLVIELFCNPNPNDDGKCLGIRLSVDAIGAATYTILDAQTYDTDWFTYDEEVVFSTPCGDITIMVPSP
jgi:hypothetical protein